MALPRKNNNKKVKVEEPAAAAATKAAQGAAKAGQGAAKAGQGAAKAGQGTRQKKNTRSGKKSKRRSQEYYVPSNHLFIRIEPTTWEGLLSVLNDDRYGAQPWPGAAPENESDDEGGDQKDDK